MPALRARIALFIEGRRKTLFPLKTVSALLAGSHVAIFAMKAVEFVASAANKMPALKISLASAAVAVRFAGVIVFSAA